MAGVSSGERALLQAAFQHTTRLCPCVKKHRVNEQVLLGLLALSNRNVSSGCSLAWSGGVIPCGLVDVPFRHSGRSHLAEQSMHNWNDITCAPQRLCR